MFHFEYSTVPQNANSAKQARFAYTDSLHTRYVAYHETG